MQQTAKLNWVHSFTQIRPFSRKPRGRNKAEALVTDVSGPKSVRHIVEDLTSSNQMMPKEFSVATDASNVTTTTTV